MNTKNNGTHNGLGAEQRRRPVVGLVLGGGAARGFAHIGILHALGKRGIVPDIVVGTSIGAVVGGCYAAGQLDVFEAWARGLQPRNILSYLDLSFSGSGLIGGGKLAAELETSLGGVKVDELPIKYAAIATEVRTGHEIWLTHGRLTDAMRASYALPGIFAPVDVAGRWLVDGALVNPVPVSAARAMGAEIVIAANVCTDIFGHGGTIASHGAPDASIEADTAEESPPPQKRGLSALLSPERLLKRQLIGGPQRPGISTVMVEAFNIMQDRITRARLAGDPPDVLITPRVNRIGWFEFHRAEEAIEHGFRAAERTMDSIEEAIAIIAPTANAMPGVIPDAPA